MSSDGDQARVHPKDETRNPPSRPIVDVIDEIQRNENIQENYQFLFNTYFPRCHSYFKNRGFSVQESEDMAQEVFCRVYRSIGGFRRASSFDTWFFHVVANVWKSALRHRQTKKVQSEQTSLEERVAYGQIGEAVGTMDIEDPSAGPLEDAMVREDLRKLNEALEDLPDRMRQCLLFYGQGFKYREIADMLDVTVETVKKHLKAGREKLKPLVGQYIHYLSVFLFE